MNTPRRDRRRARRLARALGLLGVGGALIAACSLDADGLHGSIAGGSTGRTASGATGGGSAAGTGGMSGTGGAHGEPPPGDADACPGAPIALSPPGIIFDSSLQGRKDDLQPGCGPTGKPDVIYAVTPTVTGTLTATLTSPSGFTKSLSLRSICDDNSPIGELSCDANGNKQPLLQTAWVTAGVTVYVIVDGDANDFTLALSLSECGDGKVEGLEQCDDAGCPGCVTCGGKDEIWDPTMSRCYRLVTQPATWVNARASCVQWGGDLAGVGSKEELDFLLKAPSIAAAGDIWAAGYELSPACVFIWVDGEPWFPGVWAVGEPNNLAGNERCAGFNASDGHLMDDRDCATPRAYLCERAPKGSCGDGHLQSGEECDDASAKPGTCAKCKIVCAPGEFKDTLTHHCYKLVTGQNQKSWDDASALCGAYGGHLAVISSPEENALVQKIIVGDTWLGGHWYLVGGASWDDGEPFCFQHWRSGEPSLTLEHCIEAFGDATWNNQPCGDTRDYLCERE